MSSKTRGWLFVAFTVVLEVAATTTLKASDGLTKITPTVIAIACFTAAVVFLSFALRTIAMSLAYIVWTAAGTAGVNAVSVLFLGDRLTLTTLAGIFLVIVGVCLICAFGDGRPSAPEEKPDDQN